MADKKQDIKVKQIVERHVKYQKKLKPVFQFLEKHHGMVEQVHTEASKKLLNPGMSCRQKLYFIFVDMINAAGGSNLTTTGESCEKFYNVLKRLPGDKKIDFRTFAEVFSPENPTIEGIFHTLRSNEYKNIGLKKAALFLRTLYSSHSNGAEKLFTKFKIKESDLYIPVDTVITDLLNQILHFQYLDKEKLFPHADFQVANRAAKEIFEEKFMIVEDLWFWGYFNSRVEKNRYRSIAFNKAKFYSSYFIYPNEVLIGLHREFATIFNKAVQ